MSATTKARMEELWAELGQRWLDENPVMEPPAGFELDPTEVGPTRRLNLGFDDGWYLIAFDEETGADDVSLAFFPDGRTARRLVAEIATSSEAVIRIQLWVDSDCVWAARRSAAAAAVSG